MFNLILFLVGTTMVKYINFHVNEQMLDDKTLKTYAFDFFIPSAFRFPGYLQRAIPFRVYRKCEGTGLM